MHNVLENRTMGTKLTLWATVIVLALSAIAAVTWWVVVWRNAPALDWRGWLFLAGVGVVQLAAWIVILLLLLRVRKYPSFLLALAAVVLGLGSLFSHLLNGFFTPVFGAPFGLVVLVLGLLGLAVARRVSSACT